MLEFTDAFLKPFAWAKTAYENLLGVSIQKQVSIAPGQLTEALANKIPQDISDIKTARDWNTITATHVTDLGGLYKTLDQADTYLGNLTELLGARLTESAKRLGRLRGALKALKLTDRSNSSTSIDIVGGDSTWVEQNSRFYRGSSMLARHPEETVFRLQSTGSYSSIRSLGGFAGAVRLDKSIGQIYEEGNLEALTDGSADTYWIGKFLAPAPIKVDQNDVPWVPAEYRHGFPVLITYYLDRPTNISEIYIDPVSSDAFDLVAIRWVPISLSNVLTTGTFASSGVTWSFTGHAERQSTIGMDNGWGLLTYAASGWASYTFSIASVLTKSVSGIPVSVSSSDYPGQQVQTQYSMRGVGSCRAGARLVWINASGAIISYKIHEDYPSGFFRARSLNDLIPTYAVSGRVDVGIFTASSAASAMFDNVELYAGSQNWNCNVRIDRPTTVSLPAQILTDRVSFVLVQRNPKRERLLKNPTPFVPITNQPNLDQTLQNTLAELSTQYGSSGPGNSVWAYSIGIRELDLRNREYVPHGSLVSLPLQPKGEIRRLWLSAEVGSLYSNTLGFFIYPFATNENFRVQVAPYLVTSVDSVGNISRQDGEVLHVATTEEQAAPNWVIPGRVLTIDPKPTVVTFDGTDTENSITLELPPHLRKLRVDSINRWLDEFAVWPANYDPNVETLYGVQDAALRDSIRAGTLGSLNIPASSFQSITGYRPIKVTVKTDRWTALPDIYGGSGSNRVRTVIGEELPRAAATQEETSTAPDVLSYDAWLSTTILQELPDWARRMAPFKTLKKAYATLTLQQILAKLKGRSFSAATNAAKGIYKRLRASGGIGNSTTNQSTHTVSLTRTNVYQTKFSPLIVGTGSNLFRLFWYNGTNYIPVSPNDYVIDANVGVVTLLANTPVSGYTTLIADYKYLSTSATEDFAGNIIELLVQNASSGTDSSGKLRLEGRALPITRNMTDYLAGRPPELKPLNLDRLAREYHPVLEYYLTSDGKLVFSEDLSKHGETPADITVEWETLGLVPRFGVQATRSNFPSASISIYSLSFKSKELSPVPTRGPN